ncbi:MAG TPA: hypothetical protein VIV60_36360, partial [Polyangiaceae bacterium]
RSAPVVRAKRGHHAVVGATTARGGGAHRGDISELELSRPDRTSLATAESPAIDACMLGSATE